MDSVNGIAYYGDDKLLLSSIKYLTVIDFRGKVLDRVRLNSTNSDLQGFDFSVGRLEVSRSSGLQFDPISREVLLGAVKREGNGQLKKYVASISVPEKRVRLIKLPDFISKNEGESFGNLNGFCFRRLGDELIVNPGYASELVLIGGGTSRFFINSSITPNKAQVYLRQSGEYSSIMSHKMKSVEFYPVFSSYDGSVFFRIHKGPINEKLQREPFYLMVTDRKFNKLLEIPFPENYYISPIISKEGLMFMAFNKHDDKLELIRYRFK